MKTKVSEDEVRPEPSGTKEAWVTEKQETETKPSFSCDRLDCAVAEGLAQEGSPGPAQKQKKRESNNILHAPVFREEDANPLPDTIVRLVIRKRIFLVDKNKTIFSTVVTNKKAADRIGLFFRRKSTTSLINILWFFCNINGFFICFKLKFIPIQIYAPLQIILSILFVIHHSLFIRVDIAVEIAKSFNFWFTVWNALSLSTCIAFLWGYHVDVICAVAHIFTSILLLVVLDSHAKKDKKIMRFAIIIGIINLIPTSIVLFFNIVEFDNQNFYYKSTDIQLIDVRLQALDNITCLMIYLLRIFYTHSILKKTTTIAFLSDFYEIEKKSKTYERKVTMMGASKNIAESIDVESQNAASLHPNEPIQNTSPLVVQEGDIHPDENAMHFAPDENQLAMPNSHLRMGLIEDRILEYDLNNTLYHHHVRHQYPLLSKILKSKTYNLTGATSSFFALFMSLPLAAGLPVEPGFLYVGTIITMLGSVFIFLQMILTCNYTMVRHMLHSFDYCYVMVLIFKILLSSGLMCHWDGRMIFWFLTAVTFNWSFMVDTFHVKSRKLSYLTIVGTLWMLTAAILCKLNTGDTFEQDGSIKISGVSPVSFKVTLSTSAFSTALFTFRFFWSYLKNPKRILFITENFRVE